MSIIDKLRDMKREELLSLAATQGVQVHWKAKNETIIKQIVEKISQSTQQGLKHVAEKPSTPVFHNTPEEVEEMLSTIKMKVPSFESIYDRDENTWTFRCKGAEECGNLDIPMRVIQRKAAIIARGKIALRGLNDHFDKTNASGLSAYTNSVLAG